MAATPSFASVPRAGVAVLSTANANRDGTGTVVTILTASSAGTKVEEVRITPAGTTTAGMVRLYLHDGTTFFLFGEFAIAALTPTATVPTVVTSLIFDSLILPSGWSLRASTERAEQFRVAAFGGDF